MTESGLGQGSFGAVRLVGLCVLALSLAGCSLWGRGELRGAGSSDNHVTVEFTVPRGRDTVTVYVPGAICLSGGAPITITSIAPVKPRRGFTVTGFAVARRTGGNDIDGEINAPIGQSPYARYTSHKVTMACHAKGHYFDFPILQVHRSTEVRTGASNFRIYYRNRGGSKHSSLLPFGVYLHD